MKTFKVVILFILACSVHSLQSESLWNEENDVYSNKKKFKVGDRIKIVFNEKSLIDYNLSVSEGSRVTGSAGGGNNVMYFDFLPALSADDSFNISQKSATKNKNTLSTSITVEVVQVLTNNNIRISGRHHVKVNDALEQITVSGTVHPDDIRNKKYVNSSDIINPVLTYNSQIAKQEVLSQKEFTRAYETNRIVVSGQTQVKIVPKYEVPDKKKQELILQYLNKILTILFK
ncbi:MAG: flagellar basal body L-ring protein FlgH [bacterium]|nr:flagellar basal body L-ring protein FlgH [bacterium]